MHIQLSVAFLGEGKAANVTTRSVYLQSRIVGNGREYIVGTLNISGRGKLEILIPGRISERGGVELCLDTIVGHMNLIRFYKNIYFMFRMDKTMEDYIVNSEISFYCW